MCRSRKRAIPYVNPALNISFLCGYGQVTQLFHPSFLPPSKHSLVIGCGAVLLSCSQRRTWRSKRSTLWNQSAHKRPSNVYSTFSGQLSVLSVLRWREDLTPALPLLAEESSPLWAYLSPSPDGSLNNSVTTYDTLADVPGTPSLWQDR